MGWQLVEQLFDAVPLPWTVHIGHPVLWNAAEVLIHLQHDMGTFIPRHTVSRLNASLIAFDEYCVDISTNDLCVCVCCDLLRFEARGDPGVLLGSTARVVVGDGVSLEVRHQLHHHPLQLTRHGTHSMLLTHTLTMHTDLPGGHKQRDGVNYTWQPWQSHDAGLLGTHNNKPLQ